MNQCPKIKDVHDILVNVQNNENYKPTLKDITVLQSFCDHHETEATWDKTSHTGGVYYPAKQYLKKLSGE